MSLLKSGRGAGTLLMAATLLSACAPVSSLRYTYAEIEHYPPAIQERIRSREVAIGMTPLQVRYTLGAPTAARTFAPRENEIAEEWTFKQPARMKTIVVIFQAGEVVKIQTESVRFPTIRIEKAD